jgi:hypothetical protein
MALRDVRLKHFADQFTRLFSLQESPVSKAPACRCDELRERQKTSISSGAERCAFLEITQRLLQCGNPLLTASQQIENL